MTAVDRLAEIEARANAATDGPWRHNGVNGVHTPVGSCVALSYRHEDQRRWEDAEFIAAARQDVPALVAAIHAVLNLHAPHTDQWVGSRCCGCSEAYPCQTVLEIEGALQ